ncbi:trifunctional serine/threonine-protein kinase/ATP-binding protein/sensor histidine kinase, partial [Microcoleus sp. S13_B4]|uniref:trifunctional serine/threonine-protein kinase/ATP-binding protein/sensor histidine kinase n=1 Tax=Microcoleus sp. S13_B4 TaxID=3055408 RepID=UPI00403F4D54
KEHPLVIFLDDLQWADSASLKLMQLLVSESQLGYLLLLGAYRDNEVSPSHPLMLTLDEVRKAGTTLNTLTLAPLDQISLNQLVADTLGCSPKLAQPLTELVYQKTQGNPFFATQFLKALHQDEWLIFDLQSGHWQCDISTVREAALTDDVVLFMAQQLQKLSIDTQSVLKLAACIGNQFDLATLAIVSESSETESATALWKALQEGLILPQSEVYKFYVGIEPTISQAITQTVAYRFLHDRVQQAAYSLIPDEKKQETHLQIGQLLLQNSSDIEQDEKIFEIVRHLNQGKDLITQPSNRQELAELNLVTGRKAKTSNAYAAATVYLKTAMGLLTTDCWQNQYELTLNIYIATAEAEYLNLKFEESLNLAEFALIKANNLLEKVKIYELKMQIHIAQQIEIIVAVEIGLEVLEKLSISLLTIDLQKDLIIDLPNLDDLDNLPLMTDPYKLAAMQILRTLCTPVFVARPEIFPQLIITMINLCLKYGDSALSSFAYGFYGLLLVGSGQLDRGYHAGLIALKLLDKFNAKELKAKVYTLFNANIRTWKEPAKNSVEPLREGVQAGLEVGDFEWGGYCAGNLCSYLFFTEDNLESAVQQQEVYVNFCINVKQELSSHFAQIWRQLGLNLQGQAADALLLIGKSFDEEKTLPRIIAAKSGTVLFMFYVAKTILLYLLGDSSQALTNVGLAQEQAGASFGFMQVVVLNFYHSLTLLNRYTEVTGYEQNNYLEEVNINQEKMKFWAENTTEVNRYRYELIEAEKARVLGINWQALELYDRAIQLAKENQFLQEEALAYELAAKFYLDWAKEKVAASYMQEAYYCYARWGAKAKVEDLEKRYAQLLQPILNQPKLRFNPLETLGTISHSSHTSTTSSTSISDALDFASIVQAAQALSSKIQIDELLATLNQIILKTSGAETCALLLPHQDEWQIRAITHINPDNELPTTLLQTQPLDGSAVIPLKLVYYVKHTLETVVIEGGKTDIPGLMNDCTLQYHSESMLCTPILDRGNLVGILYLEHRSTKGVFTRDRLLVLNFLCTQAAISLENARLYQQAQDYAHQVEQSQLQLVQSEKMSALGNLVAGVAHEINNPVGFISGNIHEAIAAVKDITEYLQLYQEKFPSPGEEIEEKAEESDIEYLLEDLPKMLNSMQIGCDRIQGISTSLRTFSRADKDYKVPFNIHDGINSTILILKHRLKANEQRPAIEVVKEYGNLPSVDCFPGQLNQVFMNILANAIDALEESNRERSLEKIKAAANCITIRTERQSQEWVTIRISDNGPGISDEIKGHIFDHLFTTKGVGKGTGLGLAIARQIVAEKHSGMLEVNSTLGWGTQFTISLPC